MVVTKMWNVWRRGSGPTMRAGGWIAFHYAVLGLAILGLAVLAWRRRWEALVLGTLIGGITVLGGLLLAVPRRNVPLMPLVLTLAAAGAVWLAITAGGWLAERRRAQGRAPERRVRDAHQSAAAARIDLEVREGRGFENLARVGGPGRCLGMRRRRSARLRPDGDGEAAGPGGRRSRPPDHPDVRAPRRHHASAAALRRLRPQPRRRGVRDPRLPAGGNRHDRHRAARVPQRRQLLRRHEPRPADHLGARRRPRPLASDERRALLAVELRQDGRGRAGAEGRLLPDRQHPDRDPRAVHARLHHGGQQFLRSERARAPEHRRGRVRRLA